MGPTESASQSEVSGGPAQVAGQECAAQRCSEKASLGAMFILVLFGALAGVVSWYALHQAAYRFHLPPELESAVPPYTPEVEMAIIEALPKVFRLNTILATVLVGMICAGMLGVGSGLAAGCLRRSVVSGAVGLALGALFGWAAGEAASALYYATLPSAYDPDVVGLSIHALVLGLVGVAGGLAVSRGTSRGTRAWLLSGLTGLAAGVIAAMCAGLYSSVFLPTEQAMWVIPSGPYSNLAWTLAAGVVIATSLRGSLPARDLEIRP